MSWLNPFHWGISKSERALLKSVRENPELASIMVKDFGLSSADASLFFGQEYAWSRKNTVFTKMDIADQEDLAKKLDIVYMCLRAIRQAFVQPTLYAAKIGKDGEETVLPEHPALSLFDSNPAFTGDELKEFYISHLICTGTSFFWKWRGERSNAVTEIYPVLPSWTTIKTLTKPQGKKRLIDGYLVNPPGADKEITISYEDMVYTRVVDPASLVYGLSPLAAGSKAVQLENKRYEYMGDALDSLKVPGPVIKTERGLTQRARDDLKAILTDKLGKQSSRNMIHLGGKNVSIEFLNPLEEMNWQELTNLDETRICGCMGVPPLVAGAQAGLENSPWSNTDDAWRWFYRSTMMSLWRVAARSWTRGLVLEPNVELRFDTSNIVELQEDAKEAAEISTTLFSGGLIRRDEGRVRAGYEPLGDALGEEFVLPINMATVTHPDDRLLEPPPQDEDGGLAEDIGERQIGEVPVEENADVDA